MSLCLNAILTSSVPLRLTEFLLKKPLLCTKPESNTAVSLLPTKQPLTPSPSSKTQNTQVHFATCFPVDYFPKRWQQRVPEQLPFPLHHPESEGEMITLLVVVRHLVTVRRLSHSSLFRKEQMYYIVLKLNTLRFKCNPRFTLQYYTHLFFDSVTPA